jgi:hypothetical protein
VTAATGGALDLDGCPALRASRDYSRDIFERLGAEFARRRDDLSPLLTIAVAGSLGRLEATPHSDLDCILVLRDGFAPGSKDTDEAVSAAFDVLAVSRLKKPKSWGIYRAPVARRELLEPAVRGSLGESPEVFGKRIQLLLDARPLHDGSSFDRLRRDVLDWYAPGSITRERCKQWTYLINDLVRYLHSYAAWQQFKLERTAQDSWLLRQAKLRGSRVLTIAALLFLLGESGTRGREKYEWLASMLDLSPLERLASVYEHHEDGDFSRVLGPYEFLHGRLADPAVRAALIRTGPDPDHDSAPAQDGVYDELYERSNELMSALLDFLIARRGQWDEAFFRYLIL